MPKAQKHYEDCSKSCSSAARIPSQQMQDSSRDEARLPDVPDVGTLVAAVPVQRDRRSMSRRPGQNGRIEKRGDSFSLLFYQDVPGTTKRQRVRRSLKAT